MAWLLNWIWQGTIVSVVATTALRALGPRVGPAVRYRIWWAALLLVVVLPIAPPLGAAVAELAARVADPATPPRSLGLPLNASVLLAGTPSAASRWAGVFEVPALPSWCGQLAFAMLVVFWCVRAARVAAGLRWLRHAKLEATPLPASLAADLMPPCAPRARGAALVQSGRVRVAAVLGLSRPLIALAPRALAALPRHDLVRVVAHEQAHVDRRDDVAVLAQRVIMAVAGWHPALMWLDRRLSAEREWACDDRAVAATGDARGYARCLVRVAEVSASSAEPHLALGVSSNGADVLRRVDRLLDPSDASKAGAPRASRRWDRVAALAVSLVVAAVGMTLRQPFDRAPDHLVLVAERDGARWVGGPDPIVSPQAPAEAPIATGSPFAGAAAETDTSAAGGRTSRSYPGALAPAGGSRVSHVPRPQAPAPPQVAATSPRRHAEAALALSIVNGEATAVGPVALLERPLEELTSPPRVAHLSEVVEGADALAHIVPATGRGTAVPSPGVGRAGTAWWEGAARAGVVVAKASARSARVTASAFPRVGRAMRAAFSAAPGEDGAMLERRASDSTPGTHAWQR